MTQDEMMAEITHRVQSWHNPQPASVGSIDRYCVIWARETVAVLTENGLKAQLQAGSASWEIVTPETDDGVSPNRLAYEFTWDAQSIDTIAQGLLPEIHTWVGIAPQHCPHGRGQLIDLTTQYAHTRGQEYCPQANWEHPPLWCYLDEAPAWASYRPSKQAISLAYAILRELASPSGALILSL